MLIDNERSGSQKFLLSIARRRQSERDKTAEFANVQKHGKSDMEIDKPNFNFLRGASRRGVRYRKCHAKSEMTHPGLSHFLSETSDDNNNF